MKKFLISSIVAGMLTTNNVFADESGDGGFLGFQIGTGVGGHFGGDNNSVLGIIGAFGIKGGYQSFFNETNGVRVYLSAMGALQFAGSIASGSVSGLDMYAMGDIDVDYLANFIADGDFTFGMYVGVFTGALLTLPLIASDIGNQAGVATNSQSIGIAAGLNLGLRTTVHEHNEFEFGIKLAGAFYQGNATNIGALLFIGAGYNYKF